MADKAATIYVVDLGASMGQKNNGRSETDLDFALKYVWDRILNTVSNGRKTDCVGVVGFRTDGTDNDQAHEAEYRNIIALKPLGQMLMAHVRELQEAFKPSHTNAGDGVSALVIAISMMTTFTKQLKYIRKIIFVTNGMGAYDPDGLGEIARQLMDCQIELTILGVDFDDSEYGFKEENKDERKRGNEAVLRKLCEDSKGVFATLEEAVNELGRPRLKKIRPVHTFKGKLMLGDLEHSETAMGIDIERYPNTALAKATPSKAYVHAPEHGEDSAHQDDAGDLQQVKSTRVYQVEDANAPGGKKDVDKEELEKGYMYGRTVVAVSKTDEEVTILETEPGLQIVGFVPAEGYRRYFSMSNTSVIVGQKANTLAIVALSSIIHALYELDSYAVARLVKKKNQGPVMVMLAPLIEPNFEALVDVELPFNEDIRKYQFPPLGTVKSVTGKQLEKHRFIPTPEMERAMADYVDAMDLSTFGKTDDDEDEPEYAAADDTFSPVVHRINQVVRHRALHPAADPPPIHSILLQYSQPPEDLVMQSQKQLDKLITTCEVKKVPPRAKGTKRQREAPKPKSGLDVAALLSGSSEPLTKKAKISRSNAIPEFKRRLEGNDDGDLDDVVDATKQMAGLAKELITTSLAHSNYSRACELLGVVRSEMIEFDEPDIYNERIRELKKAILGGECRGDRTGMWTEIRKNRLGLVTQTESDRSKVMEGEAREFLSASVLEVQ